MRSPRPRLFAAALAVLTLGLLGPVLSASALAPTDVSDFSFESFDGQYHLDTDAAGHATARVVETLVARFPDFDQNRGIIRAIPLTDGEYPLDVHMVSVTDENGTPVYFERNDYDGFAEFALGTDDFVHGRVTYVLTYDISNPIRHFGDSGGDEFYWDINGTGWAQGFDRVNAHVFLSPKLAASFTGDAACYVGYYGDTGDCSITANDQGTEFDTTVGPVTAYSTLTVAIGFRGGTVVQPELPRDSWIVQLAPKLLLGLAGLLVAISIVIRTVLWRDARGRGTIIAEYTPPEGSNLLLDANIVGRASAGLPALFVDFAVRGLVHIVDTKPGTLGGGGKKRFTIELVTTDGATPAELRVLVILFGMSLDPGTRVNPGYLDADIGASLYGLPATTAALASKEGLRAPPAMSTKLFGRIALWLVLLFVPIWIWASVFDVLDGTVVGPAFATLVLAIAVPAILAKPKLLTEKGAAARDYLLGLREYLTIAEEERLRVLQSPQGAERINTTDRGAMVKLNERLLPYAVLWGVEDQWVQKLQAEYPAGTPSWLEGEHFDSSLLRSFTNASTSSVRPIVTTSSSGGGGSWSSSGGSSFSSGSSGGGFSGGGGGGGGGGGR